MIKHICAGAFALLATGCIAAPDMAAIEAEVARFYERQMAGDDNAIYSAANADFRRAATLDEVHRLNSAVRGANCRDAVRDPSAWNNNISTESGHLITVTYDRTCVSGPLRETFIFRIMPEGPQLLNYNAESAAPSQAGAPASQQAAPAAKPSTQTPAAATPPGTRT